MKVWLGACVALLACLLGGCDGSSAAPEPKETFSPSPSGSPSPSATNAGPVEPTTPSLATERSDRGAQAFVEFFFALVDYAQATGETSRLKQQQNGACATCVGGLDWIKSVYEAGGQITGGAHTVTRSSVDDTPSGPAGRIVGATVAVERTVVSGAGKLNEIYPAGTNQYVFTLIYARGRWQVASWDFV